MAEYIEREAFKRKLVDEKNFFPAIVARALDEMPAADVVEVKHGEWLEENKRAKSYVFICSNCGGTAYYPQPNTKKEWHKHCPYKYCPHCNAKMDGGRNETL